jgi:4-hydroxymandelate oxidase
VDPQPVCLADFERLADAVLPTDVRDWLNGGSGTETTLALNRSALEAVAVVPRVLAGAEISTRTRLLQSEVAMPAGVAPMAYQRMVHRDGEVALAAAAAAAGVPYVASTLSSVPIEDIAGTGAEVWFQLYWLRERSAVQSLVGRAVDAGCTAMVLTVDVPVLGPRLRDVRNAFALPADVTAANLTTEESATAQVSAEGSSALVAHTRELFAPALSWHDFGWLRQQVGIPLVLKGILDLRDARRAADAGADGIVVSNHGGRQLDGAVAAITALPPVVDAIGNDCEVLLDSGVRSGTDVLRALALGASGVLVGRPLMWALAVDGGRGARLALSLLQAEIRDALALAGCADPGAARDLRTVT